MNSEFHFGPYAPVLEGQSGQPVTPSFEDIINGDPYFMNFASFLKMQPGFEQSITLFQVTEVRQLFARDLRVVKPFFDETVAWMTERRIERDKLRQKLQLDLDKARTSLINKQVNPRATVQLKNKNLCLAMNSTHSPDSTVATANSAFSAEVEKLLENTNTALQQCYIKHLEKLIETICVEDIDSKLKREFGKIYSDKFQASAINVYDSTFGFIIAGRTRGDTQLPLVDPCTFVLRNLALEDSARNARDTKVKQSEKFEGVAKKQRERLANESAAQGIAAGMDTDSTDQLKVLQEAVSKLTQQVNQLKMGNHRSPKNELRAGPQKRDVRKSKSPSRFQRSKSPLVGGRQSKSSQSPGPARSQQRNISTSPCPSLRASRLRSTSPHGTSKETTSKYQMNYEYNRQPRSRGAISPKRAKSGSRSQSPTSSESYSSNASRHAGSHRGRFQRRGNNYAHSNRSRSPVTTLNRGRGRGRGARGRGQRFSHN